jgi:biopolymer transport protein ExbD
MDIKRRLRRRAITIPEISLTPLIDVAFTLLIIFMITAPMMRMTIRVDLPDAKTSHETKVEDETLMVEMDAQGGVLFDQSKYDIRKKDGARGLQAFQRAVAAKVTKHNNNIFLSADKSLRYEHVIKLFDILNPIEGVQHVALVTQKAD